MPDMEHEISIGVRADTQEADRKIDNLRNDQEKKPITLKGELDASLLKTQMQTIVNSIQRISAAFKNETAKIQKTANGIEFKSIEQSLVNIEGSLKDVSESFKNLDISKINLNGLETLNQSIQDIQSSLSKIADSKNVFEKFRPPKTIQKEINEVTQSISNLQKKKKDAFKGFDSLGYAATKEKTVGSSVAKNFINEYKRMYALYGKEIDNIKVEGIYSRKKKDEVIENPYSTTVKEMLEQARSSLLIQTSVFNKEISQIDITKGLKNQIEDLRNQKSILEKELEQSELIFKEQKSPVFNFDKDSTETITNSFKALESALNEIKTTLASFD